MSSEQNNEILSKDIIDNSYKNNKYFKMIYKPIKNKKEKKKIIKKMIDEDGFIFNDEKEIKENIIRIFGKYFIKQNKNKCYIIYNNKKYKLEEYFNLIDNDYNYNIKEIKVKLIGINNITNMFSMSESNNETIQQNDYHSYDIYSNIYLSLFEDIKENEFNEIYNNIEINYELNEINKGSFNFYDEYNTSILKPGNNILNNSENILNFHQTSSANINKIKNMNHMFSGCISLKSLPDLSKLDTSKVTTMGCVFNGCKSLVSLPDISKWNTINVSNINKMFNNCHSLISLPDISNWDTSNIKNMRAMLQNCNKLISLPDLS